MSWDRAAMVGNLHTAALLHLMLPMALLAPSCEESGPQTLKGCLGKAPITAQQTGI